VIVLVRRGDLRAAIASVLPHAGKESEDTPGLGRLRFVPTAERLLVWATDYGTSALADARITSHVDGDLDAWDLSTQSCKQVLAVFQGPSGTDARMMWEDGDLRIELTDEQAILAEVDAIPSKSRLLRIPRILTAGEDTYPDVARTISAALALLELDGSWALAEEVRDGVVSVESMTKLVASGKAWDAAVRMTRCGRNYLARCGGDRFAAVVPNLAGRHLEEAERRTENVRDEAARRTWMEVLEPLLRPLPPPPPPADVVEDLKNQAASILAFGGDGRLRVVREFAVDGDQPLPLDEDGAE
jgi:hypothetical protein